MAARHAGATQVAGAAQFSVSVSFVAKLAHRQRASGSLAARPGGSGSAPRLGAGPQLLLRACLRQTPDFLEAVQAEDFTCFKFIDEPSTNRTCCRRYARGARLRYLPLPPYSPDFNPIERALSKLKTGLRTAQARTREAQEAVIQTATEWITGYDAKKWVDHCGYHVH